MCVISATPPFNINSNLYQATTTRLNAKHQERDTRWLTGDAGCAADHPYHEIGIDKTVGHGVVYSSLNVRGSRLNHG